MIDSLGTATTLPSVTQDQESINEEPASSESVTEHPRLDSDSSTTSSALNSSQDYSAFLAAAIATTSGRLTFRR